MIGILDPALLLPRPGQEAELVRDLREVAQICRRCSVELPMLEEYWPDLWREFGRPLEATGGPATRTATRELAKLGSSVRIAPLRAHSGSVYGFAQLFEQFGQTWVEAMRRAVARASQGNRAAVLIVRRLSPRNLEIHSAGASTIGVVTRWVLTLNLSGDPPRHVRCVYDRRNLDSRLRWTSRFDPRLPTAADGASHPFCPPDAWWKRETASWGVVESKPAWLDSRGNGWARPNVGDGTGYHWDVFLNDAQTRERIGLSQLNIVEFGAPLKEGKPGDIHHVPKNKQHALKSRAGWSCKR